ncbi:type II secretion system protein [Kiritimatiellaeota bacterium B1221]|nr:type II secretion system protein [Kiritimatiellaeota bacterium B1221]
MKNQKKQGFTLVEIMIVVMIIGLLAAIALPSFKKARDEAREKSCINSLRLIEAAKDQYAIDNDIASGTVIPNTELQNYMKGETMPTCPSNGTISANGVDTPASCTTSGHEL